MKLLCYGSVYFFLIFSSFSIHAGIYKCETPTGIVYRDKSCGDPLPIETVGETRFSDGGLRSGELRMLEEAKAKYRRSDKPAIDHGYTNQLRLRELRMRRGELQRQLQNPRLSVGSGIAVLEELRSIDRETELIYRQRQ